MKIFPVFSALVMISYAIAQTLPTENSKLPILHISTTETINDYDDVLASFGITDQNADNSFTGTWNAYNGHIGIKYRGSSSSTFEKKAYSLELQDEQGEEIKAPLLNMPKESEWALIPGFGDKTLIRNAFAYTLAAYSGQYAPRTRLVELVLNESYEGVYLLVEKVSRDSLRIDISKLDKDDNAGDSLTGGYILRIDRESDYNGWYSTKDDHVYYQHYYPKDTKITSEQREYIQGYIKDFEDMIMGSHFADSATGYSAWIAKRSFADYLLLQELVRNVDGYRLSAFLYKEKDKNEKRGQLHAGPVWDLDITTGNADYYEGWKTEGWVYEFDARENNDSYAIPVMWPRLAKEPKFAQYLNCRWKGLRSEAWSDKRWKGTFDSLATLAGSAQERNYDRWDIMDQKIWPAIYVAGSYQGELDTMKTWLQQRIKWMDDQFSAKCDDPISTNAVQQMQQATSPITLQVIQGKLHWNRTPSQIQYLDLQGHRNIAIPDRGIWLVRWKEKAFSAWQSRIVSLF